eukprot:gene2115-2604_t
MQKVHPGGIPMSLGKPASSQLSSLLSHHPDHSNNNNNNNNSPSSSYPSSPIDQASLSLNNKSLYEKKLFQQWVQELNDLRKRESILLENIKNFTPSDDSDDEIYSLHSSIMSNLQNHSSSPPSSSSTPTNSEPLSSSSSTPINKHHNNSSNDLLNLSTSSTNSSASSTPLPPPSSPSTGILIQQHPPEYVVCHRYIHPSPIIVVDQDILNKCGGNSLIVNAQLVYRSTQKQVTAKSTDGKQEILQGVKSIMVDKNGIVIFNKLKVSEVSSKHLHQSFSICFTLSEISLDNQVRAVAQITSSPFHVLSRSNKRKSDEIDTDSQQEPSSPSHTSKQSSPVCSSPSSPLSPMINKMEEQPQPQQPQPQPISLPQSQPQSQPQPLPQSQQPVQSQPQQQSNNDPNYIDITDLLVLPQKEAAARLGISESMLCKRFKECTRRKWPYRYIRKIDKVIKILSFQNANEIPKEEKEKLERFILEREERLRPVKIRITGCIEKDDDPISAAIKDNVVVPNQQLTVASPISPSVQSQQQKISMKSQIHNIINSETENDDVIQFSPRDNSKLSETFTNGGEGNGLENILETLEMLKHTRQ